MWVGGFMCVVMVYVEMSGVGYCERVVALVVHGNTLMQCYVMRNV